MKLIEHTGRRFPSSVPRRLFILAVNVALLAGFFPPRLLGAETYPVKSVLLLLTGQPGLPASVHFYNGFRITLLADSSLNVDVSTEHISFSPFPTKEKRDPLVRFLGETYR